jgi:hypothetical protein
LHYSTGLAHPNQTLSKIFIIVAMAGSTLASLELKPFSFLT